MPASIKNGLPALYERCGSPPDSFFLEPVQTFAQTVTDVTRSQRRRPAAYAADKAAVLQVTQIALNRHVRHAKYLL